MSTTQFDPLQIHPKTGELFLRLPSPHDNIIITPPRMSDAPTIVSYMNDPALYYWLEGPPFPYLPQHAEEWLTKIKTDTDAARERLDRANEEHGDAPPVVVPCWPIRSLREVREDGSELFIGDITLVRERWPDLEDKEAKATLERANAAKEDGDPSIVWCIGDYLAPSHHGKGIMTAAIRTLLDKWAIPRMGVRQIRVETFTDNIGSRRVFEKLGFVFEKTVPLERRVLNSGRRIEGMDILWWKADS
ncbi:acyl-CoA N-acyltransferase [Trametes coccinea BRFM310]|uniref:Acyl-CoA N-acyltransferase n=1 Tax=Trametes coccinea (strain BRFM310) TaxID=1353009 RepID=A0A1Y2IQ31_TRAC3|nr:acyl-CoA N-acyltransferase [Trametes coccinea BRFM310]